MNLKIIIILKFKIHRDQLQYIQIQRKHCCVLAFELSNGINLNYFRDEQKSLTTDYECLNRSLASLERVSKKKELKNRHDVINKSILRAIKRYLVHVFKTHHVYRRFKERNKKLDYFDTSLTKFVTTYKHLYSTSEMYILFGYLFDAKMFNEVLNRVYKPESKDIAEFTEVFNDCWIHYSHKKFEEIIVNENFIKLYSIFKSNKQLSFLRNHQRVSKNKSEYKLALTEIESKLELL